MRGRQRRRAREAVVTAPPLALVVEDDFLIRLNTAETLLEAGFEVLQASNAAIALEVLKAEPRIQLVFTDVQMPGELDGIDLALLVRQEHPRAKVIVTSAFSQSQRRLPDAIPFLPKPFVCSRLIDLAREQVGVIR